MEKVAEASVENLRQQQAAQSKQRDERAMQARRAFIAANPIPRVKESPTATRYMTINWQMANLERLVPADKERWSPHCWIAEAFTFARSKLAERLGKNGD